MQMVAFRIIKEREKNPVNIGGRVCVIQNLKFPGFAF